MIIKAKFEGLCRYCKAPVYEGEECDWVKGRGLICRLCVDNGHGWSEDDEWIDEEELEDYWM
jgi:hypothetical protein